LIISSPVFHPPERLIMANDAGCARRTSIVPPDSAVFAGTGFPALAAGAADEIGPMFVDLAGEPCEIRRSVPEEPSNS
jgi:hypothetical protein